jgi:16S rRNA (guanine527-N7)-methyltransferase
MLQSCPVFFSPEPMAFDPDLIRDDLASNLQELVAIKALPGDATKQLIDDLILYLGELAKWNKAYNLTAVRDPQEMVVRHILDSLSAAPSLRGTRILDAGTGAGLPGIPLALCYPDRQFTLLDSNGKKIRFIQHVAGELGLTNVLPVQVRVESYEIEERFDTVISRAFTALADFVSNSGHLIKSGGCLLAMKGKLPQAELQALPHDWQATNIEPVNVPGLAAERHIIVLEPLPVPPGPAT